MNRLEFIKCHGLENDYLFIDLFKHPCPPESLLPVLARTMSHRRQGVGADGIVLFSPDPAAIARMRIFNADGSEAETCGNALRCIARLLWEEKYAAGEIFRIATAGGIVEAKIQVTAGSFVSARINMGKPIWAKSAIPMIGDGDGQNVTIVAAGRSFHADCVSFGNPHCIIFDPHITPEAAATIGPEIERYFLFPRRINVEFASVLNVHELRVIVWERGSGLTAACGSGACAVFAAARSRNLCAPDVIVHLPGGDLEIEELPDGSIGMTGPAERVFKGTWTY
jgi:diaminopimelate epimerase